MSSAISLTCSFDFELICEEPCAFGAVPPSQFYFTTPVCFRLFLFEHIIEISSAISPIYRFDLKLLEQGAMYIYVLM